MRRGLPGVTPLDLTDLAASDSESSAAAAQLNNTLGFDCEAVAGAHVLFRHGSPICLQLEVFGWHRDVGNFIQSLWHCQHHEILAVISSFRGD